MSQNCIIQIKKGWLVTYHLPTKPLSPADRSEDICSKIYPFPSNAIGNILKYLTSQNRLLDEVYPTVTPKHESGNPTAFANEVQAAAENLLAIVDGKPKEVFSGTYSQVKEILGKIHESGYFDQAPVRIFHFNFSV